MAGLLSACLDALTSLLHALQGAPLRVSLLIAPLLLFLELPYYLVIIAGVARHLLRRAEAMPPRRPYRPRVSCLITCYSEGNDIKQTLHTLCEQTYPGHIEIIPVIDGAIRNADTTAAARDFIREHAGRYPNRRLLMLPKWQRGGRVSSLNAGLSVSRGEIIMALDGDTSFDNDMVSNAVRHFVDPRVCAVSGALMVRNWRQSFVTRMQRIEYSLSLMLSKVGLSEFNILNNVSGAFGVFRRSTLVRAGGWNTGTAEDLDLTLRMKQYFMRNRLKIVFEPLAVGHTDTPSTWKMFLQQRLRWDGDLLYLYLRKHRHSFNPQLVGWPNFIMLVWGGLLFQAVAPFVILFYLVWSALVMPLPALLASWLVIYLYYLIISIALFSAYLVAGARQPQRELSDLLLLPAFSLFVFITRLWSCVAILNELWRRGHEETSMAPWWVLKRTTKH